jgi:deoxycytidylate deaminase
MSEKIIQRLERLAIETPGVQGRFKLAAGVVYKKRLIATGVNSYKTHPIMLSRGYREGQYFLHAEVDAIKNSLRLLSQQELTKCDLYIVRVKHPKPHSEEWIHGLAKPCDGCSKVISGFEMRNVYYTSDEGGGMEVL